MKLTLLLGWWLLVQIGMVVGGRDVSLKTVLFVDAYKSSNSRQLRAQETGFGFLMKMLEDKNMLQAFNVGYEFVDVESDSAMNLLGTLVPLIENRTKNVVAVVGPSGSAPALVLAPFLSATNVLQLTTTASTPELAAFASHFRTHVSTPHAFEAMVHLVGKYLKVESRIGLFYRRGAYGSGFADAADLSASSGRLYSRRDTVYVSHMANQPQYDEELLTLKSYDVRVILMIAGPSEIPGWINSAKKHGMLKDRIWIIPFAINGGVLDVILQMGVDLEDLHGVILVNQFFNESQVLEQKIAASSPDPNFPLVNPSTKTNSQAYIGTGYDAADAVIRAIYAACNLTTCTGVDIIKSMHNVSFDGVISKVKFDQSGDSGRSYDIGQIDGSRGIVRVGVLEDTLLAEDNRFVFRRDKPFEFNTDGNPLQVPHSFPVDLCPSDLQYMTYEFSTDSVGNVIVTELGCASCPPKTINFREDGMEVCLECPSGLEYDNGKCVKPFPTIVVVVASLAACIGISLLIYAYLRNVVHRARRRAKEAEERANAEEEFVSVVFHEVRNPFAGVCGNLMLAMETLSGITEKENNTELRNAMESARKDLSTSMVCCKHVTTVLDNVLDLSRLQAGKARLLIGGPFELNAVCKKVLDMCISKRQNKDVKVEVVGTSEKIWVRSDEQRLRQLLINVFSNALTHTEEGFVQIKLTHLEDLIGIDDTCEGDGLTSPTLKRCSQGREQHDMAGTSMFTSMRKRNRQHGKTDSSASNRPMQRMKDFVRVKFEISDTGCGIPDSMRSSIFSKFTIGNETKGTGLGLAISQSLAKLFGSEILLESPWGNQPHGSKFYLTLKMEKAAEPSIEGYILSPLGQPQELLQVGSTDTSESRIAHLDMDEERKHDQDEDDVESQPISTNSPHYTEQLFETMKRWNVLIADDVAINQKLLSRLLCQTKEMKELEFQVRTASTGEEALKILDQPESHTKFDLIILDQHMEAAGGVLSGTETMSKIQELEEYKEHAPIIVIASGNCNKQDLDKYQSLGADLAWPKPYPKASEMLSSLQNALREKRHICSH